MRITLPLGLVQAAALALGFLVCSAAADGPASTTAQKPPHLLWAERLVAELSPALNVYGWSPTYVVWSEDGSGPARNRSVCSSFVSHDLERAYGFGEDQMLERFGLKNPKAKDYYAAIMVGRGFTRISRVQDLAPGDIIAVRYPVGSHPTGHVMILDTVPRPHPASAPLVKGTQQYEAVVIDSSHSYHGLGDTRFLAPGKHGQGVGRGTVRLYANPDGTIAGYTWSPRSSSKFFPQNEHELDVGRFDVAAPASTAPKSNDDETGGDNAAESRAGEQ